jgi:hypothetical protein
MSTALWPLVTNAVCVVLGVVLGLLAEPLKARALRRSELKPARREIYAELAQYLANIESANRGLGHHDHSEDARAADFESSKLTCKSPPKFEVIQWYKSNRLDLLLHIDSDRGIRMLIEQIAVLHGQANAPASSPFGLPQRVIECLRLNEKHLDKKLLRKYIKSEHQRQAGLPGKN